MTVDVRCTVITDRGISASGSLSEDHIDASNALAKVRGSIQFLGVKQLARGTEVKVAYSVPGFNEVTRFPRQLWVLSSKVDPFEEITTTEVGCLLTLKSDLRPPDVYKASNDEPAWVTALPDNMKGVIPAPVYAQNVLSYCLGKLGITAESGNVALTSAKMREELDLSGGYVQVINDLLSSESCYGFINPAGKFVVRKVLTTGASGPVLTRNELLTLEGIDGGAPTADQIRIVWDGAVQAPPGIVLPDTPVLPILPDDPGGTLDLTTEQEEGIDAALDSVQSQYGLTGTERTGILNQGVINSGATPVAGVITLNNSQYATLISSIPTIAADYADQKEAVEENQNRPLRDWTYDQTISSPKTFKIEYVRTVSGVSTNVMESVKFSAVSTNVTKFEDVAYMDPEGVIRTESVAVLRVSETENRVGPANPTRWKSKRENGSPARAGDTLYARSETEYLNVPHPDGIRVQRETTTEFEPLIAFGGGLGIQNWVGIDLGLSSVPVSRTVTIYEWDDVADLTKTTVSRWLAWGKTTEGAQGAAAFAKALEQLPDVQRIPGIYALVDYATEWVFDGSEVRISQGRGTVQRRGTQQDRTRDALTRDPVTSAPRGSWPMTVSLNYGTGSVNSTTTYELPYPADDTLEAQDVDPVTLRSEIVPGNVQEQARVFGETQNYLTYGHSNGVAITTEIRNIPTEPLGMMFIEAAGVAATFRANGTSWAWGSEGMIVGTDALLHGTAGTYAPPEFSDCWVPVPVAIASLPTLSAATTNGNPQPANTITTPVGFDPTAPGSLWASLPTNGTDLPATVRTVAAVIPPRNERIDLAAHSRTRVRVLSYPYALNLGTTTLTAKSVSRMALVQEVSLPVTVVTVTALPPAVFATAWITPPVTVVTVTALPPVVGQAGISLPVTTVTVTALPPTVEQIGAVIDLPLTTITVTGVPPIVKAKVPGNYFGSWAQQNAPWINGGLPETWWGN
jgi:hypothetical protein